MAKINEEYILVMQKVEESPSPADEKSFIAEVVKEEMLNFREQVCKNPAKDRLLKLDAAIEKLSLDIQDY